MLDYNLFKPIRNLGLLLIAIGAAGSLCFIAFYNDHEIYLGGKIFVLMASIFHLFMGYNILSRNKLGFKCLKIYLYLLYPGFPLGYFYAKRSFKYIEANNIKDFFGKSIII